MATVTGRQRTRVRAAAVPVSEPARPVHPAHSGVLSVIIPLLADHAGMADLHRTYKEALADTGFELEFIYVLDRLAKEALAELSALKKAGEPITAIVLSRWDGEVAALRSGFRHARGDTVLTLPARRQIDPVQLPDVLAALDDCDMAIACRSSPGGDWVGNVQAGAFRWLIKTLFGRTFSDPVCRVRACRRQVLEETVGHSAQQHFLPLLAAERGFEVREVPVRSGPAQNIGNVFGRLNPWARMRLTLDALALYVVLKFVRKPLRFFGAIGLPILALGLVFTGALAISRLAFGVALADRPALLLGVLLIVLGIQVIGLGLIGEIIIFASGRRIKDYRVEKIL